MVVAIIASLWYFLSPDPASSPNKAQEAKIETLADEAEASQFFDSPALIYLGTQEALSSIDNSVKLPTTINKEQVANLGTQRAELDKILKNWAKLIAESNSLRDPILQELSAENRLIVLNYLKELGNTISQLSSTNSGLSQSQIDTYLSTIAEAQKKISAEENQEIIGGSITPLIPTSTSGKPELIEGVNRK